MSLLESQLHWIIAQIARPGGSMLPVKICFGILEIAVLLGALYFLRNRKQIFSGSGGDRSTDSPAAANLPMCMVILVLLHAGAILAIMIFEL